MMKGEMLEKQEAKPIRAGDFDNQMKARGFS
jgi:hypothetical protein